MKVHRGKMVPEQPSPKPITVPLTPEQVVGVMNRRAAIQSAINDLNAFLAGIVTGHGHDGVSVEGFDPDKRTLTVLKRAVVDKPVGNV